MKIFNIQILTMMMVAVMSYAASNLPVEEHLLKEILKEAKNVSSKVNKDLSVVNVLKPKHPCAKHFFCLAEKSLEKAEKKYNYTQVLGHLTRVLSQYNNKTEQENCNLKTDERCRLGQLLDDIQKCAHHSHM